MSFVPVWAVTIGRTLRLLRTHLGITRRDISVSRWILPKLLPKRLTDRINGAARAHC